MWSNLPFDILATIFSHLSPDSLARAKSTCRNWKAAAVSAACPCRHPPWFLAFPTRGHSCYAHNPITQNWHVLPLDHTLKPIATIHGLILAKFTSTTSLQLAITNPFTRQFKSLPKLNYPRTNPAVGLVETHKGFKIYVAGGMSEAPSGGGAVYQPTIEAYDSSSGTWTIAGPMPVELAVRLTVWTPNESVYSNGTLYWMTSARAYSAMGLELATFKWRELSVPMADQLEFAALVPTKGRLGVVGGTCGPGSCRVWELREGGEWEVVGKVPYELGGMIFGERGNWGCVKCVGVDGVVCLYREMGLGFVIGKGCDEWEWVEGCCFVGGREIKNVPIKGLLVHPNLAHSALGLG